MNIISWLVEVWKNYRLPLALFVFTFNTQTFMVGFFNLILQKTCFPEGPPGTSVICNNSLAFKQYNRMSSTRYVTHDLLAGLVLVFAGPWRDETGQSRPLIILGHIGELFSAIAALVPSLIWSYSCWASVIVESFSGAMGSRHIVFVASLSYVIDKTSQKQRPLKMAQMVGASLGGMATAQAIGGYLLKSLNYAGLMVFLIVVYLLSLTLFIDAIRDGPRSKQGAKIKPMMIVKRLKCIFMPRKNFLVTWVIIFASIAVVGTLVAETALTHSYLQKVLYLNPESSGLLQSFRLFASLITSVFAIPILVNVLKFSEFTISIISTIPTAISCFGMAFVSSLMEAYIFYGFDMMRISLTSILWSILSQCVPKSEIGVYASLLFFGEAISPLLINPLYVLIFNSTIDYFPGAYLIISGVITLTTTVLLIISSFKFEREAEVTDSKPKEVIEVECELKVTAG